MGCLAVEKVYVAGFHDGVSPHKKMTEAGTQTAEPVVILKASFHLTISMRDQCATGKNQRNDYRHGSYRPSLTGKTSSVSLIFTHETHRNVKNR